MDVAVFLPAMRLRYVLPAQAAAEREFLPATAWWKFAERFNVAPAQYVPAIRLHDGRSEGVMLRWGLIPAWFEGDPTGSPKACVRSERIERAKIYRTPWLNGQRCILPMAAFYTWQLTKERYRQPFLARLTPRSVFGVAAVWDRWVSADDDVIEGCALVTVPANELVAGVTDPDSDMPAVLRRNDYPAWLHGSAGEARAALRPYDSRLMEAHPVSPRINCAAVDDAKLMRPSGASLASQAPASATLIQTGQPASERSGDGVRPLDGRHVPGARDLDQGRARNVSLHLGMLRQR